MYGLSTVTTPTTEPVTLAEAKLHLRVETIDNDDYIQSLISTARQHVEEVLGRALITQSLKLTLDEFPRDDVIRLPRSPVQSITSITYLDTAGASQTIDAADYRLDAESIAPRLVPAYGESWPSVRDTVNAIAVTFVAGYGATGASVPAPIKHAIKLLVGTYYDVVREAVLVGSISSALPHAVDFLLGPYRVATHVGADA